MLKNGEELWAGKRPYALQEVTITDEGWVIGYAYRTGEPVSDESRAAFPNDGARNPPEYLHIVILDDNGHEILNEINERIDPRNNFV